MFFKNNMKTLLGLVPDIHFATLKICADKQLFAKHGIDTNLDSSESDLLLDS
jgi:ABC-type nitrate/sulfonate/bicarbonate transport system substrate-binding protein